LLLIYSHFLFDYLTFEQKGDVINYLYNINNKNYLEEYIFNYINNNYFIEYTDEQYILFENKGEIGFYKKTNNDNNDTIWIEGENYLNELLETTIKQKYLYETEYIVSKFSQYIGYLINIHDKKNNSNTLTFKLKFMKTTKGSGIICEQYQKKYKLELINDFLLKKNIFTNNVIKGKPKQICVFIEFIFRHFNNIAKEDKIWFLNPIKTVVHKQYKPLKI